MDVWRRYSQGAVLSQVTEGRDSVRWAVLAAGQRVLASGELPPSPDAVAAACAAADAALDAIPLRRRVGPRS